MTSTQPEQAISADEVASRLGVTKRTVMRWVAAGVLEDIKLGGHTHRFFWSDVLRYVEARYDLTVEQINELPEGSLIDGVNEHVWMKVLEEAQGILIWMRIVGPEGMVLDGSMLPVASNRFRLLRRGYRVDRTRA